MYGRNTKQERKKDVFTVHVTISMHMFEWMNEWMDFANAIQLN